MTLLKEHVNILAFLANIEDENLYDCEICIEKGWQLERNCQHEEFKEFLELDLEDKEVAKKKSKYSIKVKKTNRKPISRKYLMPDGTTIDYCPMSHFDKRYADLVSLIMWSEEMGILPFSPPALMEQSNVYVEARWTVVGQLSKIRKYEEKKNKEAMKQK